MRYYPITIRKHDVDFDDFDDMFKPFWGEGRRSLMRTDISEKEGKYLLEMEMPGFEKKDIEIAVENGYLTITARKCEDKEENGEGKNYLRRERRCGSMSRSFYVGDVSEEDIAASYNNGVLEIVVPKEEEQKPQRKQIEIK